VYRNPHSRLDRRQTSRSAASHLWDACRNAFKGRLTKAGTIPLHAWATIKKPYKELMHFLLASPVHVLICGRQGNDFAEDDESGEMKNLGYKMRAEGETAYEPDVLVRLEAHKPSKKALAIPTAHVEKDRTAWLAGQSIPWPTFDNLAGPLLACWVRRRRRRLRTDEVGVQDAEALARQEWEGRRRSAELTGEYTGTLRPGGDGRGTTADRRGAAAGGEGAARGEGPGACTANLRASAGGAAHAGGGARAERGVT